MLAVVRQLRSSGRQRGEGTSVRGRGGLPGAKPCLLVLELQGQHRGDDLRHLRVLAGMVEDTFRRLPVLTKRARGVRDLVVVGEQRTAAAGRADDLRRVEAEAADRAD